MNIKVVLGKNSAQILGRKGERFACRQLKFYGLEILERNFSIHQLGEIDIIARDGLTICFVEVKTRQESILSNPRDAINWHKRLNLWKAAMVYLRRIKCSPVYRFDMVEIFAQNNRIVKAEFLTHIFCRDDIKKVL